MLPNRFTTPGADSAAAIATESLRALEWLEGTHKGHWMGGAMHND
jgi:hypothetical protein